MSAHPVQREVEEEAPDIDTREYARGATTFYEVGRDGAWIEISEEYVLLTEEHV